MKKNNWKYLFFLLFLMTLNSSVFPQKKLAVTRVRNNHTYYFTEGKKLICKTYDATDSVYVRHQGTLAIVSDSVIRLDYDTLLLSDIVAVKKFYSTGGKIALSCLLMYFPLSSLIALPLGIGAYQWAIAQGFSMAGAEMTAFGVVVSGGYLINYTLLSNSSLFKAYTNIGGRYTLNILQQ